MENDVLKKYFIKFDEFPHLLKTQSYNDDDYQFLMKMAIGRGKKLTENEIGDYFENNYDIVEEKFDSHTEEDFNV